MESVKKNKGFTLVEMIVAVGLFSLIASISIGAVLMIFSANTKSQTAKSVVDDLNLAIEDMTRTVRFGEKYHCGSSGNLSTPNDCENGSQSIDTDGSDMLAVTFKGGTVVYRRCGTDIKRSNSGAINCNHSSMKMINTEDTVIEKLNFYVLGTSNILNGRFRQPYVIAVIKGYIGSRPDNQSRFFIQTMMSQRKIDYD